MIPKNIFQSWCNKELHPEIKKVQESILKSNPEYKYFLYDDEEIDKFVNDNYPGEISECYNKLNIIVAKVDFWRYLVLYKYGGVYLDMDSSIVKPLKSFISEDDEAVLSSEISSRNCFVQWMLVFNKGHPILKKCINIVADNIKNNKYPNDVRKMTGPSAFTEAINYYHFLLFKKTFNHNFLYKDNDDIYKKDNIKYRVFGKNYTKLALNKFPKCYYLYAGVKKKHWTKEEKQKKLLKV